VYGERVQMEILIPRGEIDLVIKKLTEATFGKMKIEQREETLFGIVDGELLIFS
jgi:hypothetical protein